MVVTDRFVFVHLHKAGGSFITKFMLRFFPESWRVGYHYPHGMIPETHRHLPVLGSVRNPWDFYVSYFHFQDGLLKAAKERNGARSADETTAFIDKGNDPLNGIDHIYQVLTDDGAMGFKDGTAALAKLCTEGPKFDRLVKELPIGLNRRTLNSPVQQDHYRGMNVLSKDLDATRASGMGLVSFLFHHIYGTGEGMTFLKMETLRDDLPAYLESVGVTVTDEMHEFIHGAKRVNASKHNHYSSYYDPALIELVGKHDGEYTRRFGYSFEEVTP